MPNKIPIQFDVDEGVHKAFKILSIQRNIYIKDYLVDLMKKEIKRSNKGMEVIK